MGCVGGVISGTRSLPGGGYVQGVPLQTWDTTGYSWQAGGTHSTGILSCFSFLHVHTFFHKVSFDLHKSRLSHCQIAKKILINYFNASAIYGLGGLCAYDRKTEYRLVWNKYTKWAPNGSQGDAICEPFPKQCF